jgi:hypothetical protein
VAAFYADECFPLPAVEALRRRGHDVLTAAEAGHANQRVPDHAVLTFATRTGRAVLTLNRHVAPAGTSPPAALVGPPDFTVIVLITCSPARSD